MTAYIYRAARPDGEMLSGTVEAGSPAAALQLVESRGLFPIDVDQACSPTRKLANSLTLSEISATLAGLGALIDAGLPVDRALAAVEETASPRLQPLLENARDQVSEGASLSAALETAGACTPLVIGYLRAGERSGKLGAAIQRAAQELERSAELRARIRAALTYPAFLLAAGAISVVTIVGFVVPRFAAILAGEGHRLPASTRLLISASLLVSRGAIPVAIALVVGLLALSRWIQSDDGKRAAHEALLALPLVGPLRMQLASARACAALGSLLEAAVPILPALGLAQEAADDAAVGRRIAQARLDVERGEPVATALKRHAAMSAVALRLAAFGERSGRQAIFLEHAARLESAAAQRTVQRLMTLLEPALIMLFGVVVAFVAAALLQAVYSVRPGA